MMLTKRETGAVSEPLKLPEASKGIAHLRGGDFCNAFALNDLAASAHSNACRKGFWDDINISDPRHVLSLLALITTETSEAVEAIRKDDRGNFAEELADILIRVFDVAGGMGINLGAGVIAKMAKNEARAFRHGKKL